MEKLQNDTRLFSRLKSYTHEFRWLADLETRMMIENIYEYFRSAFIDFLHCLKDCVGEIYQDCNKHRLMKGLTELTLKYCFLTWVREIYIFVSNNILLTDPKET